MPSPPPPPEIVGSDRDVCSERDTDPLTLGAVWGEGNTIQVTSGDEALHWRALITLRLGHVKTKFEQDLGIIDANTTEERQLRISGSTAPHPRAADHLVVVVIRIIGEPTNGSGTLMAKTRLAERYAAFHDGLESDAVLYADDEWHTVVPWGLLHPSPEEVEGMHDTPHDIFVDASIPSGRSPEIIEFEGKDLPDHTVVPEDDALITATPDRTGVAQ